jgi:HEXXH motif-containing protein
LRKTPVESIVCLCNFLNGESALHGRAVMADKQYWTALGDFYYAGPDGEQPSTGEDEVTWNRSRSYRAPCLSETIPIDFFSPNTANGNDGIEAEYLEFSSKERFLVCRHLEAALSHITAVSDVPGRLVKEFIKVIIPYKVAQGHGSTSQPRFPGRVLLRGVEESDTASLAGSLIHEAIHQLLYVLEYEGKFLVDDAEAKANARVTSLWSGRSLELHSFFHACFVWYGLASFWGRAQSTGVFEASSVQRELTRCLSGFRNQNPVDALGLHAQRVRPDALSVAGKLQGHLQDLVAYCAAA